MRLGTVREDYSADGDAWSSFPHDHARSRAYRWSEDGLGGICDDRQLLCLAFALWNGHDAIMKERISGSPGTRATTERTPGSTGGASTRRRPIRGCAGGTRIPSKHSVRQAGGRDAHRGRHAPEYELLDTGAFAEGRYWEITVDYAKAATDDVCLRVSVRNAGPAEATIDVLPTLWFRNRWSWDPQVSKPSISESEGSLVAQDTELGSMVLSGNGTSVPPFCDNESNVRRLWGHGSAPPPY